MAAIISEARRDAQEARLPTSGVRYRPPMAVIYHLAEPAYWADAVRAGSYAQSTRGRTLAQEGFLHASSAQQWPQVRRRFYADLQPTSCC